MKELSYDDWRVKYREGNLKAQAKLEDRREKIGRL